MQGQRPAGPPAAEARGVRLFVRVPSGGKWRTKSLCSLFGMGWTQRPCAHVVALPHRTLGKLPTRLGGASVDCAWLGGWLVSGSAPLPSDCLAWLRFMFGCFIAAKQPFRCAVDTMTCIPSAYTSGRSQLDDWLFQALERRYSTVKLLVGTCEQRSVKEGCA